VRDLSREEGALDRRILHAESMAAALAATVILSVLVQLAELYLMTGLRA